MKALSGQLDGLHHAVPRGSRVVYLDVPLHFNAGDLLINAGTERFFQRAGITPVKRLTFFDACTVDWAVPEQARLKTSFLRMMARIDPASPVILHGGGSLGDLYPELQAMREAVIAAFPERRIVVFPQSLHFDSAAWQQASLNRMLAHPDLHLFLRDRPSLEAVRAISPAHGALMPDMAHALWPDLAAYRDRQPLAGTLSMRRRDAEAAGSNPADGFDWADIVRPSDTGIWRVIRKTMHLDLDRSHRLPIRAWYKVRDRIIARAAAGFSRYAGIETDRLHGMLLACLLGRAVGYQDNRYGKLSRYAREWLAESPLVHPVPAVRDAAA